MLSVPALGLAMVAGAILRPNVLTLARRRSRTGHHAHRHGHQPPRRRPARRQRRAGLTDPARPPGQRPPTQRSAAKSRRRALGVRRTSSRSRAHQPPGPSVRSEASSVRTPSRRWERRSSASSPAWTRTTRQALRRCITCQLARFRTVDQACARGAAPWGRRLARTTAFRLLARRRRGRLCRASSEARHSLGLAATPMPPSSTCRSTSACLQTSSNWSQTSSAATSSPLASSACAKPKSAQPLLG